MLRFPSKDDLVNAWIRERAHEYQGETHRDALVLARIESRSVAVYVPYLYRGGWVIRGFGFSVERIGRFVSSENAGCPFVV
jgi:hypothetical protein